MEAMQDERRKGYRLLEIDGGMWQWKRGKTGVKVYDPNGKGFPLIPLNETDTALETFCECCREPDGGEIDVTLPGMVAKYIRAHLRA